MSKKIVSLVTGLVFLVMAACGVMPAKAATFVSKSIPTTSIGTTGATLIASVTMPNLPNGVGPWKLMVSYIAGATVGNCYSNLHTWVSVTPCTSDEILCRATADETLAVNHSEYCNDALIVTAGELTTAGATELSLGSYTSLNTDVVVVNLYGTADETAVKVNSTIPFVGNPTNSLLKAWWVLDNQ